MPFGQIVIGPPGSGKTTYCYGMEQFLTGIKRPTVIVNLDPANEKTPYKCDIDIRSIVSLENVMKEFGLGPNGGLIYCMEYLEKKMDWLIEKLVKKEKENHNYFIFDLPGQIELFTTHSCLRKILKKLGDEFDFRFTVVNLIDSIHCMNATNYISAVIVSLATMISLELPHVNVLSKIDLLVQYGKLPFDLDFYTEVQNLRYLMNNQSNDSKAKTKKTKKTEKWEKFNSALIEVIEDYDNVSFKTLDIENKTSVFELLKLVDKANGYIFGSLELQNMVLNDFKTNTTEEAANEKIRNRNEKEERPSLNDLF